MTKTLNYILYTTYPLFILTFTLVSMASTKEVDFNNLNFKLNWDKKNYDSLSYSDPVCTSKVGPLLEKKLCETDYKINK